MLVIYIFSYKYRNLARDTYELSSLQMHFWLSGSTLSFSRGRSNFHFQMRPSMNMEVRTFLIARIAVTLDNRRFA